MTKSLSEIKDKLPQVDTRDYVSANAELFTSLNKTCIIIDDDPTGNQTVYDIPLLADWSYDAIKNELIKRTPVFFILTNSRSLNAEEAYRIYTEVGVNIKKASEDTNRDYILVSRSDSTLRGHYEKELSALKASVSMDDAITFFIPVMFEGGRVTLERIHYLIENELLIPVGETPFARDAVFGYKESYLPKWIEEKTLGNVKASNVLQFSIQEIREKEIDFLIDRIEQVKPGTTVVIDALEYNDLHKMLNAILMVEATGKKKIIYRTSSSFIPSFIGQSKKSLLTKKDLDINDTVGGLIVVGSYVSKSSKQLKHVLETSLPSEVFELDVEEVINIEGIMSFECISKQLDKMLTTQKKVILYTSRKLIAGATKEDSLLIGSKISDAMVSIIKGMEVQPSYLLAKGGITSHDLATKALGMKRANVIGQILPGIPVWRIEGETKFSGIPYIVFPGNVGNKKSLQDIIQKLN